tara:strand:- start:22 stop:234 length:213 start_codon:yes stop_codon:yes gene_type:complete
MTNSDKFIKAVRILKEGTEFTLVSPVENESDFNKVLWNTGVDSNGSAIQSTTCPHSEITWTAVKAEMDKL